MDDSPDGFVQPERNYMGDLPDDVLHQIFTRLSIKVIGKCLCVSKQWYSLLKNPLFVSLYEYDCNNAKAGRKKYKIDHLIFSSWPLNISAKNCIAIRKDLVLFSENPFRISLWNLFLSRVPTGKDPLTFTLWNPTILRALVLPQPCSVTSDGPTKYSDQHLGFAFDSITNDYKVVMILEYGKHKESHMEIFSLNRHSWKSGPKIDRKYYFEKQVSCFFDGALYWIANQRHTNKADTSIIFGFDVNTTLFRHVRFSEVLEAKSPEKKLSVYKGIYLAVLNMPSGEFDWGQELQLWVMKDYNNVETWTNIWSSHCYFRNSDMIQHFATKHLKQAIEKSLVFLDYTAENSDLPRCVQFELEDTIFWSDNQTDP